MNMSVKYAMLFCFAFFWPGAEVFSAVGPGGGFREDPEKYWNFRELEKAPQWRANPFPDSDCQGLKAMLVKGKGPKGTEAEFFAYFALPGTPAPAGGYPAALLVHGGGGTAYPRYIRKWTDEGFAVMALDWYNQRPVVSNDVFKASETAVGRAELPGGKRNDIVANVANMTLAHSLLRSMPEVNARKTVFVGLSWGSWYGSIVSAVDPRYAGMVQIYCGMVTRRNGSLINGRFLHAAKNPMWWFVNTNDRNITPESAADAWLECPRVAGKTIVNRLPHSHVGFDFQGCVRMAKHFACKEFSLPVLSDAKVVDGRISARIVKPGKGVDHAKIAWTESADPVSWKREWKYAPANVDGGSVWAEIPAGAAMVYLAAYERDEGRFSDLCGTTSFVELQGAKTSNAVDAFVAAARKEYAKDPDCRTSIVSRHAQGQAVKNADKVPGIVGWEEIEGVSNVRDIGGWTGLRPRRVYRGAELVPPQKKNGECAKACISAEGRRNMRERLGIRSDMDLRAANSAARGKFVSESALGKDVMLLSHPLGSYMDIYGYGKPLDFGKALKEFARPEIYPVYVHCAGGADRTGTLCFLLETLCGVSPVDATIDYELTSFSAVGHRGRSRESVQPFALVVRTMNTFPGRTFADKVAYWAEKVAGLTPADIAAIRRNLMTEAKIHE